MLLKRPVTAMCFQRMKTANTNEYVYKGKYAQEQYPCWYKSIIISVVFNSSCSYTFMVYISCCIIAQILNIKMIDKQIWSFLL